MRAELPRSAQDRLKILSIARLMPLRVLRDFFAASRFFD